MRILAFITYSADIRHILEQVGGAQTPRITPAHGPPLWDGLMRKVLRDWSQCQTETKQHKPRRTSRSISASAGKGKKETGMAARRAATETAQNESSRPQSGN